MILTNRRFTREAPEREAKSIYIFCEGAKREYQYFEYFKEMDSRINVEIYKLHPHENNSPSGLLSIAKNCIIPTTGNPKTKYAFQQNDEVWIVLDTDKDKEDSRKVQIEEVRNEISQLTYWNLVQSNPCFEVWLYYHLHSTKPHFDKNEQCVNWKKLVNESINGGFDSRRHPIFIGTATENAEANFELEENEPNIGSTDVFQLSKSILPLIDVKLKKVLAEL